MLRPKNLKNGLDVFGGTPANLSDAMTEGTPLISYDGGALFNRICPTCGRFVKPDETVLVNGLEQLHPTEPNATCQQHGRVRMPFEGYY